MSATSPQIIELVEYGSLLLAREEISEWVGLEFAV